MRKNIKNFTVIKIELFVSTFFNIIFNIVLCLNFHHLDLDPVQDHQEVVPDHNHQQADPKVARPQQRQPSPIPTPKSKPPKTENNKENKKEKI